MSVNFLGCRLTTLCEFGSPLRQYFPWEFAGDPVVKTCVFTVGTEV